MNTSFLPFRYRRPMAALAIPAFLVAAAFIAQAGRLRAAESQEANMAPAVDFQLPDSEGGEFRLSEHRGKKVLAIFWASW